MKKLNSEFKKIDKQTKLVAKTFTTNTAKYVDDETALVTPTIESQIDTAYTELETIMNGVKGSAQVLRSVLKTEKLVARAGKQVSRDTKGYARDFGKTMVTEMKSALKTFKSDSDTYFDEKDTEVRTFLNHLQDYPFLPDAWRALD